MQLNTKFKINLSLNSIEEYKKYLMEYGEKEIPKKAKRIISRVTTEGKKNNYKSVRKMEIKTIGSKVVGGIKTTEEKDTYKEFGTGIVGSQNPHVSDFLNEVGWKYDVNEHGEKGWVYPKEDGTFGWTKGIQAQRKFYNSMKDMENCFASIASEEFKKKG